MDPAMTLQTGLDDAELDELAEFLNRRTLSGHRMGMSMLDGYLTAIVSGPETIMPSEWLPAVWGEDQAEDDASFSSVEEAQRMMKLLLRHMNEIVRNMEQDSLAPIFLVKDGDEETLFPDLWCVGYAHGIALRPAAWEAIDSDEEGSAFLMPIFALAAPLLHPNDDDDEEDDEDVGDELVPEEDRRKIAELIPDAALAINRFWKARRSATRTSARRRRALGRNNPCSCGSGKKFKKCCGTT
jgi:uncharacterized protein